MRKGQPFYRGATWERLAPDGTPNGASLGRAWGLGAASALSKYVLGVGPVEAGYKTWLVEPQPGDLNWAEGSVPTPSGPIQVRWEQQTAHFSLQVTVPAGTHATAGVPVRTPSYALKINGHPVKATKRPGSLSGQSGSRAGYVYLDDLVPGAYQIDVSH
jgi:alpha-L-rhamnosidase